MLLILLRMLGMFLLERNKKKKKKNYSSPSLLLRSYLFWGRPGALDQGGFCPSATPLNFVHHNATWEEI